MPVEVQQKQVALQTVPPSEWPAIQRGARRPLEVWRSRDYLLMVWEDQGYERLSVVRTTMGRFGRFQEGISWDDLQRLKAECGRGACWAVEVFPPDEHVVDIQNMRHLFVLKEAPPYGWK